MKKSRSLTYADPNDQFINRAIIQIIEYSTGRLTIEKLYKKLEGVKSPEVWNQALSLLDIKAKIKGAAEQIQSDRPLVVIANHPFGIADGLLLSQIIASQRNDFSVLVNKALCVNEAIQKHLLPIDFNPNKQALRNNIETKKKALDRLKQGQTIAIFPAGGVATATKPFGKAEELEWKLFVSNLIRKAQADVLPIYFEGQNSRIFHWASMLHTNLRLGLFLHEAKNKMGRTLEVHIREKIPFETLQLYPNKNELLSFLYRSTIHQEKVTSPVFEVAFI